MKEANGSGIRLEDPQDYGGEVWFRDRAIEQFPKLAGAKNLSGYHGTMAAVGQLVLSACRDSNVDAALGALRWLDTILADPRAHSEIENAVCISFVEVHELRDAYTAGRRVWQEAPERIRLLMLEQEERWKQISVTLLSP